jgi:hypothetical protein
LATAQAVFIFRVAPQQVQRHPANEPQMGGGMIFSGPIVILAELHVEHPMFTIFDTPVPAHGLGNVRQASERA